MKNIILFLPLLILFCSSPQGRAAKVIEPQGLVLRDRPSMQGKQLALIQNTEEVLVQRDDGPEETLHGRKSRWFEVKYKGIQGYAFGAFLEFTGKRNRIAEDFGSVSEKWSNHQGRLKWDEAKAKCASLGMRLPTVKELRTVYNSSQKYEWKKDGNGYWGVEDESNEIPYLFGMEKGISGSIAKSVGYAKLNLRCIR